MAVLFSPFRDKSVNPKSFDNKIHFWMKMITDVCRHRNFFVFDVNKIKASFKRKEKVPVCLDTVVQEMVRIGKVKDVTAYQLNVSGWLQWGLTTFVKRPVAWGVGYLLRKPQPSENPQYVLVELLQEKAELFLEEHWRRSPHHWTDNVLEWSEFNQQCQDLVSSEEEFVVTMQHLQMIRKVLVAQTPQNDTVIKFCKRTETRVTPLQEIELNVFKIRKVEQLLEKQIEALSQKIDDYMQGAKECVKHGKKSLALVHLRRKKEAQKTFAQKVAAQSKLQTMLQQIDDAASNDMVLKAYEYGIASMKALNKGMDISRVDDIMNQLEETFADQEEINRTISERGPPSDVDLGDLEAELDSLLSEDQPLNSSGTPVDTDSLSAALDALSLDFDFPPVPTSVPGSGGGDKKTARAEAVS